MAFFAGTGVSDSRDSKIAGRNAAREALKHAGIDKADCAIVLASPFFNQQEMVQGVQEALGASPFVGCTTAGAITESGVHEQSVAVLVLKSDDHAFTPIKVTGIGADMAAAGRRFAQQIQQGGDGSAKMALVFSDALTGNGTELVRGILSLMGSRFPLGGGAAGDDLQFKKTYQFFNTDVLTDAVVGLAIGGSMSVSVGADHGWQPIGISRVVTKARGTKIIELDGKPAFSLYQDYFGDRANDFKHALTLAAVSYPLGMKTKEGGEQIMIRAPLAIGDDGSITCGAEVVEGSEIYLMIGTLSSVLWSAEQTVQSVAKDMTGVEKRVVFVSDCVARKILLGERGAEEIELIKSTHGPDAVIFGFYSYGQIAPLRTPARDVHMCDPGFYEQSISLAAFGV